MNGHSPYPRLQRARDASRAVTGTLDRIDAVLFEAEIALAIFHQTVTVVVATNHTPLPFNPPYRLPGADRWSATIGNISPRPLSEAGLADIRAWISRLNHDGSPSGPRYQVVDAMAGMVVTPDDPFALRMLPPRRQPEIVAGTGFFPIPDTDTTE